ncbi:MarR family winged helix-turn-helix transcriptional regulator [Streptomyces guryensis]|uniref:MarR family winged helix-turn-helix transcriptional regulator n=1 Tax=Streptomyces guryensis TaxID=2886947 RepID=A0A9Q3ZD25_9ACTN|nr:MarR family winged helix-turn-helix transcriptional regulator [Streptomyces guryensis]MCD9880257.1 MarR family winged helix-turn-helix transcriptional regulator [Streptomyces guryensis]
MGARGVEHPGGDRLAPASGARAAEDDADAECLLTRELDRGLQRDCGISKAEFSVLVTLWQAPGRELRGGELAESPDWEKSRVSHQLTRMENRGFVERTECGAGGRRAGIGLTGKGRGVVQGAVLVHAGNIRRYFLDSLTPQQAAALRAWSGQLAGRVPKVLRLLAGHVGVVDFSCAGATRRTLLVAHGLVQLAAGSCWRPNVSPVA